MFNLQESLDTKKQRFPCKTINVIVLYIFMLHTRYRRMIVDHIHMSISIL